jgi:tetratricopeptide (TPR) repeat protein
MVDVWRPEWAINYGRQRPVLIPALIRLYRHIGEVARYWQGRAIKWIPTWPRPYACSTRSTQSESLERARVLAAMALNSLHARPALQAGYKEALTQAQTAAGLATRLNAIAEEALALDALQRVYRAQGDLAAAHEVDRRRLALIPRMADPTEIVEAHLGASQMGWETGNLAAATRPLGAGYSQTADNIGGQWGALRRLVILHLQWGKLADAVAYAGQGVALGARAGLLEFGEPVEALFRTHLALLYTLQGQAEAAARELAELSLLYPTSEAPPYRFALGWLHYEIEAWDEAMLHLEDSQVFPTPFLPVALPVSFAEIYYTWAVLALAELRRCQAEARRRYPTSDDSPRGYGALCRTRRMGRETLQPVSSVTRQNPVVSGCPHRRLPHVAQRNPAATPAQPASFKR